LLSGINFQGRWKNVFNTSHTKREPFKDINDNQVLGHVNMMFQRGPFPFAAVRELGSYFIELPYGSTNDNGQSDDRVSMIVVLPKKGLPLTDAIDSIHRYGLKKILVELKKAKDEYEEDEVEVYLPRFEIGTSLNIVQSLQDVSASIKIFFTVLKNVNLFI
jgi:serine protease inhibitor